MMHSTYAVTPLPSIHSNVPLQIFASHGIGGIVGNILTALFAQKAIAAYDGQVINGGWLDRHYVQLAYHLADSSAGLTYSFIMTVSTALANISFSPHLT
jgi:Amt family ammonium transporter